MLTMNVFFIRKDVIGRGQDICARERERERERERALVYPFFTCQDAVVLLEMSAEQFSAMSQMYSIFYTMYFYCTTKQHLVRPNT